MGYLHPKYFQFFELVPGHFFVAPINPMILFDWRVLWTADALRRRYGSMLCNTWYWGGGHHFRGWRPWNCGVGTDYSQHKFGRGLDLEPLKATAEEIRQDIRAHPERDDYKYISAVELDVKWLHVDTRWKQHEGILWISK